MEEKYPGDRTGLALLHTSLGTILSENTIKKPEVCKKHVNPLVDIILFNSSLPVLFLTLDDSNCATEKCRKEIRRYSTESGQHLRYSLARHFGGYLLSTQRMHFWRGKCGA